MLTYAVCAALSAVGLGFALLTAYRRRFLAALRIAALALLPVGLAMAGLVTLGRRIGSAVGHWAAGLVFSPVVWLGFVVLAVAVLLYTVARVADRRLAERRRGAEVAPGTAAPAVGPGRTGHRPARKGTASADQDDLREIEAILKKHGI